MPTKNISFLVVLVKRFLRKRQHLAVPVVIVIWGAMLAMGIANYTSIEGIIDLLIEDLGRFESERTIDDIFEDLRSNENYPTRFV